jgi:hypothetical protein
MPQPQCILAAQAKLEGQRKRAPGLVLPSIAQTRPLLHTTKPLKPKKYGDA